MSEKIKKTDHQIVLLKKNRVNFNEKKTQKQILPKIVLRRDSSIVKINAENKSACSSRKIKKYFRIIEYFDKKNYDINIFIGNQSKDINTILNKIEKGLFEYLTKNEIDTLKKVFGNRYKKIVGIKNDSIGSINFINDLIHIDDSINTINTKIYVHLSNHAKKRYLPKIFQHMWIKGYKTLKTNELVQIFYAFSNGKENIKSNEIIDLIENYSGIKYLFSDLKIKEETVLTLHDFLDNQILIRKLDTIEIPLLYEYKNIFGKIYYKNNVFKKSEIDFSFIKNRKDIQYNSLLGNILEDFGNIRDNTIYLINLDKFLNFVKKDQEILPPFYGGVVSKYWPKVNTNNLENTQKYILSIAEHYRNINGLIKNINTLDTIIEKSYFSSFRNITFVSCGVIFSVIHINFPGNNNYINLKKIFNILKLDETIPFMKFKESDSSEIKYKIFKPVIQKNKNKPYITEKELNNWRKNIIIEKSGKYKISGIPKGLSIKQLLYKEEHGDRKYSTINIMKDGKIEIKMYWKEDQQTSLISIEKAIKNCYLLIKKINKINFSIRNNPKENIPLPDIKFLFKPVNVVSNTKLTFLNTILSIKINEGLNFDILKKICRSLYNIVNVIEETALRKEILHLRYKRISNYEEMNDINTFISRQYTINPDSTTIIQNIQLNYNISLTEAQSKFLFWTNKIKANENIYGLKKIIELKSEPGIDIKIQNLQVGGRYKIMIVGIRSIEQLKRINYFLKSVFYLFNEYEKLDSGLRKEITFKNTDKIMQNINLLEKKEEELKKGVNKTFNEVQKNITPFGSNLVNTDILEISDDDEESDEEEESEELDSDLHKTGSNNSSASSSSNSVISSSSEDNTLTQTNIREYELKRLYNADPKLFKFSGNKMFGAYSTICGSVDQRQPIVISEKEKEKIDSEHPGSYTFALSYGSKKKNQYICPRIWCIKCNVSLTEQEILNSKHGKNTCPNCTGGIIPNRKKRNNTNIIPEGSTLIIKTASYWTRGSAIPYPGFIEPGKHPKGLCMPCCFKKWNSPQHIKRRKMCTNSKIDIDKGNRNKNEKYIKGPEKFPLDKGKLGMLPKVLNNFFGNDITRMITKGKSGLLNNNVPSFLRKGITQSLYNSFILAVGNIYSDRLDEYALSKNQDPDIYFIENVLLKKITPKIFISLNKGDLFNIFSENTKLSNEKYNDFRNWYLEKSELLDDMFLKKIKSSSYKNFNNLQKLSPEETKIVQHIFNIYNSYNNFINYMYSESIKDETFLLDLISRKGIVFSNGINLVIFNRNIDEDINDIHLLCPLFDKNNQYFDRKKDTAFLIKMNNYYEPICLIEAKNSSILRKKRFSFDKHLSNTHIRKIFLSIENIYSDYCSITKNRKYISEMEEYGTNIMNISAGEMYKLLNNQKISVININSFIQVVNSYNNVISIIIDWSYVGKGFQTYIPVKNSSIINNIPIKYSFNEIEYSNIINTILSYKKLDTIFLEKSGIFSIKYKIKKGLEIVGLQTETNSIIPIIPVEEKYLNSILNSFQVILSRGDMSNIKRIMVTNPLLNEYIPSKGKFLKKNIQKIQKLNQYIKNIPSRNMQYFKDIDERIVNNTVLEDNRVKQMNNYFYEKETFERIRFEISIFLQQKNTVCKKYKKDILEIINNSLFSNIEKRSLLSPLINSLFKMLFNFSDIKRISTYSDKITVRKRCGKFVEPKSCDKNKHCIWNKKTVKNKGGNKCKLSVANNNLLDGKKNINKYISLLIEEIIRNKNKSNEIINGYVNIMNYENPVVYENEIIIGDYEIEKGILNDIYNKNINRFIKNPNFYKQIKPDISNENKIVLPKKWQQIIQFDYRIFSDTLTHLSLFKSIQSILTNNKHKISGNLLDNYINFVTSNNKEKEKYWEYLVKKYSIITELEIYNNIKTPVSFSSYFREKHWPTLFDLEIISKMYSINFIIFSRKYKNIIPDGYQMIINNNDNKYIILFCQKSFSQKNIIFRVVNINNNNFFQFKDLSQNLRKMIFQKTHITVLKKKKKTKKTIKVQILNKKVIIRKTLKKKQLKI